MEVHEALNEMVERIRELVHHTVPDLEGSALAWRPDPQSNSIAWLVWHLTRIQDDHVAEIAGDEQVWARQGWAERFGLPAGSADTGFGHSADQVAAIAPTDAQTLVDYHDAVADATGDYLRGRSAEELDRVIDRSYDPPVTVGVRLVSVTADCLQHVGQAAYLRGLFERRAPASPGAGGDVDLDELPPELRSRVAAATAHARHRRISRVAAAADQPASYLVEAVAGDRVTTMDLALRPDGSVAETTRSIETADVVEVRRRDDGVELVVGDTGGDTVVAVSAETAAAALPQRHTDDAGRVR